ncbi:MAG: metal ABC transporter solute-binding protein, Zn/Mn family, partial [Candidatus Ratteibacteria bacterium]
MIKKISFILILFSLGFKYTFGNEKIGVFVSILPLSEFVEKIGKDMVKVSVMVPPGASPHTYEPTPSQLKELSKAKMYVMVGSGIEFEIAWMEKIISLNKKMLICDCSKGINLIEEEYGEEEDQHSPHGKDPHIWLSVKNAKIMVENIYQGLIKIDPKNRKYYLKNKEEYKSQLDKLDKEILEKLKNKKNKK